MNIYAEALLNDAIDAGEQSLEANLDRARQQVAFLVANCPNSHADVGFPEVNCGTFREADMSGEYVEDVAHSRQRAAACERAIAEVFAAFEAAADTMLLSAFQEGPVAEILARHGVTVQQMLEHLRGGSA